MFAVNLIDPHRVELTLDDEVRLEKKAEVAWMFHFKGDAQVEGGLVTITNGPAQLNLKVSSPSPLGMSIERDYPVPFVSIKTERSGESFTLRFQAEAKS